MKAKKKKRLNNRVHVLVIVVLILGIINGVLFITRCSAKIFRLSERLEDAEIKADELSVEINTLRDKLALSESSGKDLSSKLALLNDELETSQTMGKILQAGITTMRENFEEKESEIIELSAANTELSADITMLDERLEAARSNGNELSTELYTLKKQLQAAESDGIEFAAEIARLSERIEVTELELRSLKCELRGFVSGGHDFAICQLYAMQASFQNELKRRHDDWKSSLERELQYWTKSLGRKKNDKKYIANINSKTRVFGGKAHGYLERHIDLASVEKKHVQVLECGASWTSKLGKRLDVKGQKNKLKLTVIPCDPLADEYNTVINELEFPVDVRSEYCQVEKLTENYQRNSMDMVHFMNTLDQSVFPVLGIVEALLVVKHHQPVYGLHVENNAIKGGWRGVKWNFAINDDGEFTITSQTGVVYNINRMFADIADVSVSIIPNEECATGAKGSGYDCVEFVIRKK